MQIYYVDCEKTALLKDTAGKPLCHSFTALPFRVQKIVLQPDNAHSVSILAAAKSRLEGMRFNPANSSGMARNSIEQRLKSFCGLVIEQLCFSMLVHYNCNPSVKILLDDSCSAIDQVDLRIEKSWRDANGELQTAVKEAEIRSSFPFFSIEKAVSKNFDILANYHNAVKKGEKKKDFYLRFLFALKYQEQWYVRKNQKIDYNATTVNTLRQAYFSEDLTLQKPLVIYFTGGATKAMMADDSLAYDGTMYSENFNEDKNAIFRKMKIRNGLDAIAMLQQMLNTITDEAAGGK